jgi:anti-sigma regulatory factor (Ser/Thr protein kinase)
MAGIGETAPGRTPLIRVLAPTPEAVSQARHAIAEYLRELGEVGNAYEIEVAVDEAVKNAVQHAFDRGPEGSITLQAEVLVPDTLQVSVADDGGGMTPRLGGDGLGLGLSLIGRLASDLEVRDAAPHGTVIRMRFSLT